MVMGSLKQEADVVVVGGGPGGYVAAIRAADLGQEVLLVEARERLGGVCLIEGCIPSKALINAVETKHAAEDAAAMGLVASKLSIDVDTLRGFKEKVVTGLTGGVASLLKARGVEVVRGYARFDGKNSLMLENSDIAGIEFKNCILATGSHIAQLPMTRDLPVWTSREALELPKVPETLLVIGGGYIGLELGFVYAGLGAKVSVVEVLPHLLSGADKDLVRFVERSAKKRFESVMLETKVTDVEHRADHFVVTVDAGGKTEKLQYEQVLVAVGRKPNTADLALEKAGLSANDHGLIDVDEQCRTATPGIYAIGDIVHGPMLAHKASRQGLVAAEAISGLASAFDNRAIPAVVFTDPEVAWVGITEEEAKAEGRDVTVGKFPLTALGRAKTIGRTDGAMKVIAEKDTGLVLGVGMAGPHASDLIAEGALAIEMGATLEDIACTIHAHPTLSEGLMEAAEVALGHPVHVLPPKKR